MPVRVESCRISKCSIKSKQANHKLRTRLTAINQKQLQELFKSEWTLSESYFDNGFQSSIRVDMRTRLVLWMLEVCEAEACTDQVYSLAVNIFDRLLSTLKVETRHLQLLGCVCLSIASDLTNVTTTNKPLDAAKLCDYTNDAIRVDEVANWKALVQYRLDNHVKTTVPNDYLDVLLMTIGDVKRAVDIDRFHKLTALCSTKLYYSQCVPSMVAISCLLNSIDVVQPKSRQLATKQIMQQFKVNAHVIQRLVNTINSDFQ
jgi:hypothetical protein